MTQTDLDKAVECVDKLVPLYNQMQEELIEIREILQKYHSYLLDQIETIKEPEYER